MKKVVVTFNGKKFDMEVDVNDTAEVLKLQLYTLTHVPPSDQKILGLVKGGALKDDTELSTLNIKDGHKLIVMGKPEEAVFQPPNNSDTPTAAKTSTTTPTASKGTVNIQETIFEEDITAWQTSCSRIYFPNEDIKQPSFMTTSYPVCYACSTTCHLPNQTTGRSVGVFKCKCAEIPSKECLFSARSKSSSEEVIGKLKGLVLEDMEKANKKLSGTQQQRNEQQQANALMSRLQGSYNHVLMYEKQDLQYKARALIPATIQALNGREKVVELLHWFKRDFFSWVNQPPCSSCGAATKGVGGSPPTADDQRWQAHNVELYVCETCQTFTRFPRYNHPGKLLETRKGRCGEWANCFTLCCRALQIEARYILDFTDHVWTEVYDEETHRWVHCDPCEDQYDSPMTYETGWGKKLSYIFAFAWDHTADVSKRYTRKWKEMCERRTMVSEETVAELIVAFNSKIFTTLSGLRRNIIIRRQTEEKDELEHHIRGDVPTTLRPDETHGRTSGSEAWRAERGELGGDGSGACAVRTAPRKPPAAPATTHTRRVLTADPPRNVAEKFAFVGCATGANQNKASLQITPSANSQRGGVWLRDLVDISKGFTVKLQLKMSTRGADGMAFVVHRSDKGLQALGGEGCGLGYDGITRSVAVEFDTWQTVDRCGDPSNNHISVHTRGLLANSSHHSHSLACVDPPCTLNDGAEHTIIMQYDVARHTLDVWVDAQPVLEAEVNITELLNVKEDNSVWMGVVGATGGVAQLQEVVAWVVDVPE